MADYVFRDEHSHTAVENRQCLLSWFENATLRGGAWNFLTLAAYLSYSPLSSKELSGIKIFYENYEPNYLVILNSYLMKIAMWEQPAVKAFEDEEQDLGPSQRHTPETPSTESPFSFEFEEKADVTNSTGSTSPSKVVLQQAQSRIQQQAQLQSPSPRKSWPRKVIQVSEVQPKLYSQRLSDSPRSKDKAPFLLPQKRRRPPMRRSISLALASSTLGTGDSSNTNSSIYEKLLSAVDWDLIRESQPNGCLGGCDDEGGDREELRFDPWRLCVKSWKMGFSR
ncbi:hypothetical protein F5B22DRAFT_652478 [Xylaria bambusicola]|uniref:uncharacterized protein n=1 Tax=Xylaria bambusicola TaxID=326684 RepID=UPI002008B9BB|nr:uncharacterized protein F5B22DRAFT_652478 [Xylaria bambusicola]KAI0503024.1 hypothetical protein F5B22DRAFT_652478 [Xylaria bambusicola]